MTEGTANMGGELNTALQENITPSGIIKEFIGILPWTGAMLAAAFVLYEARKLIKGASKGKVRV